MRTIVPPLNDGNRDPDEYLVKVLETLRLSFKVDTSEAESLRGPALAAWLETAEKKLMDELLEKP
jgi:hypothetical protein